VRNECFIIVRFCTQTRDQLLTVSYVKLSAVRFNVYRCIYGV